MSQFITVRADSSGFALGLAHARATAPLRDDVARWIARAVAQSPPADPAVARQLRAVEAVLARHSPQTAAQIAGMAIGYDLPESHLLVAVLGTYFVESGLAPRPDQGCSTFAVGGTRRGPEPVLVKNRDTDCAYLYLQTILQVRPERGYRWTALSTAGAPDVHSSGMNAVGLAVADTHVPSTDVGPGLPRFAVMRRLLEECASTSEAVELLRSVPILGLGNLILADRFGEVLVVECGHSGLGVVRPVGDHVVATNHFVSPTCAGVNRYPPTSAAGRDSRLRYAWLSAELAGTDPATVRADPVRLLAYHGVAGEGAVCVHPDRVPTTVSTVVFRPASGLFQIARGTPCAAEWSTVAVG